MRTNHLELGLSGQQILHADWAPYSEQSARVKQMIVDQINFHNMRYGSLENLLEMIDSLLDQWQQLLPRLLLIFELADLPEECQLPPPAPPPRQRQPSPPPPPPPQAPYTPPPCPPPWCPSTPSPSVSEQESDRTRQGVPTAQPDRVVICFKCSLPRHFARRCPFYRNLARAGNPLPHRQCNKCGRFGYWRCECSLEVQMSASRCFNYGQFGHFARRCLILWVEQRNWARYHRPQPRPPPPNISPHTSTQYPDMLLINHVMPIDGQATIRVF
jgi:hypothetical protein